MKKNHEIQKIYRTLLWICLSALLMSAGAYGIYCGIYKYTYYRDYKSLQHIELLYVYPWEQDRFEIALKVEFVSAMHNTGVIQKLLVTAKNGKSFMIFRFDDNHIQLMSFPVQKYIGIGWLKAYYDITDKSTKEKLNLTSEIIKLADKKNIDIEEVKEKFAVEELSEMTLEQMKKCKIALEKAERKE